MLSGWTLITNSEWRRRWNCLFYNTLGQKVRTLVKSNQTAGRYLVSWDGRNDSGDRLASGVYFYALKFGESVTATRKMLFLQ